MVTTLRFVRLLPLAAILLLPFGVGQDPRAGDDEKRVPAEKQETVTLGTQDRASTIIGKEVKNLEGEKLGEIEDIVFNLDGRVSYAVLETGGVLGIGDKLLALPWSSLTRSTDGKTCVLNATKEQIKGAPGFDKKQWPDMADPKWSAGVDTHFGVIASGDRTWGGKASALLKCEIRNRAGLKAGKVEDVVIACDRARATLVVIDPEDGFGPDGKLIAVPWSALEVNPKDNLFTLTAPDTALARAAAFDKSTWPEFDTGFTVRAYTHFGRDFDREIVVGTRDPAPKTAGRIYICTHHPEVQQNAPGQCPVCKMTLITREATPAGVTRPAIGAKVYVCTHHPDVRLNSPGQCPTCKMTLIVRETTTTTPADIPVRVYVCATHKSVQRSEPGRCPECKADLTEKVLDKSVKTYVCTVHTDITRTAPGTCPTCKAALVERKF